jgi:pyruvyl transferase EpsO
MHHFSESKDAESQFASMAKISPGHSVSADALGAVQAVFELTTVLDRKIQGRRCVLLDWPAYANIGDHLIWLGQKVILKKLLGLEIIYQADYINANLDEIAEFHDAVILCSGGGNFGDLYIHHQKFRESVIRRFPDQEIIVLPQTVHYGDERELRSSSRVLDSHNSLTIFARDLPSYHTLSSMIHGSRIHLAIDAAFALQPLIPRLAHRFALREKQPLFLLRQDRESNVSGIERPENALLIDWIAEDSLEWVLSEGDVERVIDDFQLRELTDADWEAQSLRYFVRAVCLFSRASYVVTDRLHAHILALMMGIQNEAFDNSYGKVGAFSIVWTRDDPLVSNR